LTNLNNNKVINIVGWSLPLAVFLRQYAAVLKVFSSFSISELFGH